MKTDSKDDDGRGVRGEDTGSMRSISVGSKPFIDSSKSEGRNGKPYPLIGGRQTDADALFASFV